MFIIVLKYLKSLSEVDRWMKQHVAFLQKFYQSGHFIVSGRQIPRRGGIIVARASSRAELDQIIEEDPFFEHGVAEFLVIEFQASMSHPAFRSLTGLDETHRSESTLHTECSAATQTRIRSILKR